MPPEETLGDVMRQLGIYDASAQTGSPLQTAIRSPRNRPPPRQMRPAEQRAMDPNAGVRRQAMGQIERRSAADLATMPRVPRGNQFAEAGSMALEATGLPQVRRGAETLTNVARAPYAPDAPQRTLGGLGELGLGVLGAATFGEVGAMRPRAAPRPAMAPEPMPRMTPPPREIAPNGMTIRPSEPFRNSLRGGSDDLAEAAGMRAPDVGNAVEGVSFTNENLSPSLRAIIDEHFGEGMSEVALRDKSGNTMMQWARELMDETDSAEALAAVASMEEWALAQRASSPSMRNVTPNAPARSPNGPKPSDGKFFGRRK